MGFLSSAHARVGLIHKVDRGDGTIGKLRVGTFRKVRVIGIAATTQASSLSLPMLTMPSTSMLLTSGSQPESLAVGGVPYGGTVKPSQWQYWLFALAGSRRASFQKPSSRWVRAIGQGGGFSPPSHRGAGARAEPFPQHYTRRPVCSKPPRWPVLGWAIPSRWHCRYTAGQTDRRFHRWC